MNKHDRMRRHGRGRAVLRVLGLAAVIAASFFCTPRCRAFSDPYSYESAIDEAGGGGRWFTGSPADGYGCDVCHGDADGGSLRVEGLPTESGYVAGQVYEVTLRWPTEVQHLALVAEFVDERGQVAGALRMPRPEALRAEELCTEQGLEEVPGGDLLQSSVSARQFITVIDCGAGAVRAGWTAPAETTGTVWFSGGLVVSDHQADPFGDAVIDLQRALVPAGQAQYTTVLNPAGCTAGAGGVPQPGRTVTCAALLAGTALALGRRWCRTSRSP